MSPLESAIEEIEKHIVGVVFRLHELNPSLTEHFLRISPLLSIIRVPRQERREEVHTVGLSMDFVPLDHMATDGTKLRHMRLAVVVALCTALIDMHYLLGYEPTREGRVALARIQDAMNPVDLESARAHGRQMAEGLAKMINRLDTRRLDTI